jgi:hypothetical protein
MVPVGYPVWLWTSSDQRVVAAAAVEQGLVVEITATRRGIVFDTGDGDRMVCSDVTARPAHLADPMLGSPTCGHVFRVTGLFAVVAVTTWDVVWVAGGLSGVLTVADTVVAAQLLRVGELAAVVAAESPG